MAAANASQAADHISSLVKVIKESNRLHRVPKATLLHAYANDKAIAIDLVSEIHAIVEEYKCRSGGETPPVVWPYYSFTNDVKYIAEFPGGLDKAVDLVKKFGRESFEINGRFIREGEPDRGQMEHDITLLGLYHIKVSAWTPAQLLLWEPNLDLESLVTGAPRVDRKSGAEYLSSAQMAGYYSNSQRISREDVEEYMWPHTVRYLEAIDAKKTACIVVPKVVGHLLSVELVDMIIELLYDQTFVDSPLAIPAVEDAEKERLYREKQDRYWKEVRARQQSDVALSAHPSNSFAYLYPQWP